MLLVAPVPRGPAGPDRRRSAADDERTIPTCASGSTWCGPTIPAVTHVDYSARLQTVDEERNPRFDRLLEAFRRA